MSKKINKDWGGEVTNNSGKRVRPTEENTELPKK